MFGQECLKRHKSNHFASVCNARPQNPVNTIEEGDEYEDDSDSDLSVLTVESVSTLAGKGKQILTELTFHIQDADHVNYKTAMICQLDTGASCNV